MSTLIDSEAQFDQQLKEAGLAQRDVDAIKAHGPRTLSQLSFACGQPGQPINSDVVDTFLHAAFGRAPTIQQSAMLKRVIFEAQTYLVASLRQTVEQGDDSLTRKIPQAERATRLEALKRRITGVDVSGENLPANCVFDKACAMADRNVVTYLEPSLCVSRAIEIQGGNKTKELSLEKGSLVLKAPEDRLQSLTDTEMKFHYAMTRRGIALDFARIMSFSQHSAWESWLFQAMHREVPPGYAKPSLAQLIACDKAAWTLLGTNAPQVRQAADGSFPLGEELLGLKSDPTIALHLSPVSKPAAPTGSPWRPWKPQEHDDRVQPYKGKGKGKGKAKGKVPAMRQELRGKYHRLPNGDPLCFGYNTSRGCVHRDVKPGDRCAKGWHLCMEPRCQQAHSLLEHAKAK